jgi:hypothetical protein
LGKEKPFYMVESRTAAMSKPRMGKKREGNHQTLILKEEREENLLYPP